MGILPLYGSGSPPKDGGAQQEVWELYIWSPSLGFKVPVSRSKGLPRE